MRQSDSVDASHVVEEESCTLIVEGKNDFDANHVVEDEKCMLIEQGKDSRTCETAEPQAGKDRILTRGQHYFECLLLVTALAVSLWLSDLLHFTVGLDGCSSQVKSNSVPQQIQQSQPSLLPQENTLLLTLQAAAQHAKESKSATLHAAAQIVANPSWIAFPRWTGPFPCHATPKSEQKKYAVGLQFVKVPKCASSTNAGIAYRIADRHSASSTKCHVEAHHGIATSKRLAERNVQKSFAWTMLRDPASRAMSEVFHFKVSRKGMEPTDENIKKTLRGFAKPIGGFMLDYIQPQKTPIPEREDWTPSTMEYIAGHVEKVMTQYNFIGLIERMDESLVALRMILGLDAGDIISLSSKHNGSYDAICVLIQPAFRSPGITKFLASPEWQLQNAGDAILYAAVNRSLDATIDMLGREEFGEKLEEHRRLMARATEACASTAIFPCANGVEQRDAAADDCYWGDNGCGYPCLDRLAPPEHEDEDEDDEDEED